MKISHSSLEIIRKNPKQYIKEHYTNNSSHFSFSAYRLFQFATRQYHNNSDNRPIAIGYFERKFHEKFKQNSQNERRLADFLDHLLAYFDSYEELGNHVNEVGTNINIDLGSGNRICGEVFRVDLVVKGNYKYAAYLFVKDDTNWKNELRMPLLQKYFASVYGCSLDQVSIGVYCLATGKHESVCFSAKRISAASKEIQDITSILLAEEKKYLKK